MKYCKDCKHCRPWPSNTILLLPIFGWAFWLLSRVSGQYLKLGQCAASFRYPERSQRLGPGVRADTMFMENSREYGPCGPEAKLFEQAYYAPGQAPNERSEGST